MSTVPNISAVSSSPNQALLASLQAQLDRFAKFANSPDQQGNADYKALQSAIQSGNAAAAQVALARLQRDAAGAAGS